MWQKFKQLLGKVAQEIKNIFSKKKEKEGCQEFSFPINGFTDENEIKFGPGKVTIWPLGDNNETKELSFNITWDDEEKPKRGLRSQCNFYEDACGLEDNELKNIFSTYLTDLPKLICVPTLIVSFFANQEYEGTGVDISQLEEKGIAHFFYMTKRTMEEHIQDYEKLYGRPPEFTNIEDNGMSAIFHEAVLMEWSDGTWDWTE